MMAGLNINTQTRSLPLRLRETEIMWKCPADAGKKSTVIPFCPGKSGITILDKYAKLFDNYTVHSVAVEYKTTVGLNTTGSTWCGIDYTTTHTPGSADKVDAVARLTPSFVTGVVRNARIVVPARMANPMHPMKVANASTATEQDKAFGTAFNILMGHDAATSPGLYLVHYDLSFFGISSDQA